MKKPKIVCLCGSSRYVGHHQAAIMQETLAGNIVIPMGLYGHADFPPGAKKATDDSNEGCSVKQMLDELHLHKIEMSDEVLFIKPAGTVLGNSSMRELFFAQSRSKTIRFYEGEK